MESGWRGDGEGMEQALCNHPEIIQQPSSTQRPIRSSPIRDSGAKVWRFPILTKQKKDCFSTIYFQSIFNPVSIQSGMKKGTGTGRFPSILLHKL